MTSAGLAHREGRRSRRRLGATRHAAPACALQRYRRTATNRRVIGGVGCLSACWRKETLSLLISSEMSQRGAALGATPRRSSQQLIVGIRSSLLAQSDLVITSWRNNLLDLFRSRKAREI